MDKYCLLKLVSVVNMHIYLSNPFSPSFSNARTIFLKTYLKSHFWLQTLHPAPLIARIKSKLFQYPLTQSLPHGPSTCHFKKKKSPYIQLLKLKNQVVPPALLSFSSPPYQSCLWILIKSESKLIISEEPSLTPQS